MFTVYLHYTVSIATDYFYWADFMVVDYVRLHISSSLCCFTHIDIHLSIMQIVLCVCHPLLAPSLLH